MALLLRHHLVSCQDSLKEASGVANNVSLSTVGTDVPNNDKGKKMRVGENNLEALSLDLAPVDALNGGKLGMKLWQKFDPCAHLSQLLL